MNITQALRLRDDSQSRLVTLYSNAHHFGWTHNRVCDEFAGITKMMEKGPGWVRSYIDGYRAALTADLYRDKLVFGGWIDGRFYSVHRKREDYYEANGIEPREFSERATETGHYWSDSLKPFFTSKDD